MRIWADDISAFHLQSLISDTQKVAFGKEKPSISLLYVNKQINAEAAWLLYDKNKWRLGNGVGFDYSSIFYIWKQNSPSLRHIIVHCDQFDYRPVWHRLATKEVHSEYPEDHGRDDHGRYDHGQRQEMLHTIMTDNLMDNLYWKLNMAMDHHKTLSTLVISLENLYCPQGCCRLTMLEEILAIICRRDVHTKVRILFHGLKDKTERDVVDSIMSEESALLGWRIVDAVPP